MTRSAAVGVVTAMLGALTLTACGAGNSDGDGDGEATASPSPSTLGKAAYESALRKNLAPLNTAIAAVDKAKGKEALNAALSTAAAKSRAAGTALTRLQSKVPADIRATHRDLAFMLGSLGSTFSGARDTGGRCAPPSRVALGDAGPDHPVQRDLRQLAALGYRATLRTPRSEEQKTSRPASGTLVDDRGARTGPGELVIDNGTDTDGAVTLTVDEEGKEKPVFTVFVRASSKARVSGIKDNQYSVFFTTGQDWSREKRSFTSDCSFKQFTDPAFFFSGGGKSTILTYTLHEVENGNAPSFDVREGAYPY